LESAGSHRILVVDDDQDIVMTVQVTLELEGFEVMTAHSARQAEEVIRKNGLPHLAIVDIMMPDTDGIELCRNVQKYCDLPVIMLTAVDDEAIKVSTINEVAEDYVNKPFHPPELVARVKRIIRRIGSFAFRLEPQTKIDDFLTIDFAEKRAIAGGKVQALTPIETKLLHILIGNARRTVRTDYLLGRVWPLDEVFEDTLRVHIHRLRQKIEPDASQPRYLMTQRGTGYSFLPTAA
jgi:DNA-binding response OmpR family regulator